jgi:hypothetical protein
MERRLLTEDDRALLRTLLHERVARGAAAASGGREDWTREQCSRLLQKIDGPGKTVVVESALHEPDEAERRAEASGCG